MLNRYEFTKMRFLIIVLNFVIVALVLNSAEANENKTHKFNQYSSRENVSKATIMRYYQENNCVSEDGLANDLLNLDICQMNNIHTCLKRYIKTELKGITMCEI